VNYRKGQKIVLNSSKTKRDNTVTVIQFDSRQGWLAKNNKGDWVWYHLDNEWQKGHDEYWEFVKTIKK